MRIALIAITAGALITLIGFFYVKHLRKPKLSQAANCRYLIAYDILLDADGGKVKVTPQEVRKSLLNRMTHQGYAAKARIIDGHTLELEVPGTNDTGAISRNILSNTKFQFRELYAIQDIAPALQKAQVVSEKYYPVITGTSPSKTVYRSPGDSLPELVSQYQYGEANAVGIQRLAQFVLPDATSQSGSPAYYYSGIANVNESDTVKLNDLLRRTEIMQCFPVDLVWLYDAGTDDIPGKKRVLMLYATRTRGMKDAVLGNEDISSASKDYDQSGKPELRLQFDHRGIKKWEKMTADNVGRGVAVAVSDIVLLAPIVNGPITGGSCTISGDFTVAYVETLAISLQNP